MGHNSIVSNWDWDHGYKSASFGNEYPLRVDESGPDAGLQITMVYHEKDRSSQCNLNSEEFAVILSVPWESMSRGLIKKSLIKVPILTNSLIFMEPELTITSDGLHGYSPNERGCFYNSERRLDFYKIYSENNCNMECGTNYMIKLLGRVPFFSPRM